MSQNNYFATNTCHICNQTTNLTVKTIRSDIILKNTTNKKKQKKGPILTK